MKVDDANTTTITRGAQGFVSDLVEAARANPTSTALISMGLLWMVMGRNGGSAVGTMRRVGRTAVTGLTAGGRTVGAGASSVASSVSDAVSDGLGTVAGHASAIGAAASRRVADGASSATSAGASTLGSVGDGVSAARHDARDLASGAAASAGEAGRQAVGGAADLMASMRDGFADLLQRQPLVVGAVGLAVGAGVAAALPRIAAEDALVETVGGLKDSVREGLGNAYARAANEARAQGLTPDAASRAASEMGEKVTDVAKTTFEEAKRNLS